jgi:hypothetical protein
VAGEIGRDRAIGDDFADVRAPLPQLVGNHLAADVRDNRVQAAELLVAVVLEVSNAGCPENSEKQISAMMAISTPAATKSRKVSSNQMTSFLACLF